MIDIPASGFKKNERPMEITLSEFADIGLLQELNRVFGHPLGVHFAIENERLVILDFLWSPGGCRYEEDALNHAKMQRVRDRLDFLAEARWAILRDQIQQVPEPVEKT